MPFCSKEVKTITTGNLAVSFFKRLKKNVFARRCESPFQIAIRDRAKKILCQAYQSKRREDMTNCKESLKQQNLEGKKLETSFPGRLCTERAQFNCHIGLPKITRLKISFPKSLPATASIISQKISRASTEKFGPISNIFENSKFPVENVGLKSTLFDGLDNYQKVRRPLG
jgi:hypothetical protein